MATTSPLGTALAAVYNSVSAKPVVPVGKSLSEAEWRDSNGGKKFRFATADDDDDPFTAPKTERREEFQCYADRYSDLKRVIGYNKPRLERHYKHRGRRENRTWGCDVNVVTIPETIKDVIRSTAVSTFRETKEGNRPVDMNDRKMDDKINRFFTANIGLWGNAYSYFQGMMKGDVQDIGRLLERVQKLESELQKTWSTTFYVPLLLALIGVNDAVFDELAMYVKSALDALESLEETRTKDGLFETRGELEKALTLRAIGVPMLRLLETLRKRAWSSLPYVIDELRNIADDDNRLVKIIKEETLPGVLGACFFIHSIATN